MSASARRCLLFVPGSRPERFEKALAAGADAVCIDLEDAVLPDQKAEARRAIIDFLAAKGNADVELIVRINSVNDEFGEHDLKAFATAADKPDSIMLPKTETAADVQKAQDALDDQKLIALIESPRGILNAQAISTASDRLTALMFGGADYAAELRGEMSWEPLFYARCHLAVVAAAAHLDLIDVPYLDVKDENGLKAEVRRVKAMGFTCKSAIHPAQVAAINAIFSPTEKEIEKAREIIAAFDAASGGAVLMDGKFIDRPIVIAAERVVAIARATRTP